MALASGGRGIPDSFVPRHGVLAVARDIRPTGLALCWLEPLAAILAGTGAFIPAAVLIFRRVDSAWVQADAGGVR